MKLKTTSARRGDASLLDLLVMFIAVAIVAMVGFAYLNKPRVTGSRIYCVNNLKQVGLSFRMWAGDNDDKYPAQVSTNAGGAMELVASGLAFPHFNVMSNELCSPKVLLCPSDAKRRCATNFTTLRDANISYFVVPEASETVPEMWLSGDRNLATNTVPLKRGLFTMPTNRVMSWTAQMHNLNGNICFADGSVQQYSSTRLYQSITNALQAYSVVTNNTSFRLAIP